MPDSPPPADSEASRDDEPPTIHSPLRAIGGFLRRHWLWGLVLAMGLYLWYDIAPDISLPESGPPAPDFSLQQMNGGSFRLSEYAGEVVVLNVWATWCPPCRFEIPGFVDLQAQFAGEGVTFVGLSVDDEGLAAVRSYFEEREINYPQVASRQVAGRKYRGSAVPRTYVIDKRGRIRYEHTGLLLKGSIEPVLEALVDETAAASRNEKSRPTPRGAAGFR